MPVASLYQLRSPGGSHSCRDHVIIGVLQCTLHRAVVEDHPEATANSKHRVGNNNRYFLLCHMSYMRYTGCQLAGSILNQNNLLNSGHGDISIICSLHKSQITLH